MNRIAPLTTEYVNVRLKRVSETGSFLACSSPIYKKKWLDQASSAIALSWLFGDFLWKLSQNTDEKRDIHHVFPALNVVISTTFHKAGASWVAGS